MEAAVLRLAVRSGEENEDIARMHPGADLIDGPAQPLGGRIGIEHVGDIDPAIEPLPRGLHRLAKRLGIGDRLAQRAKERVVVGVDADGDDMKLRARQLGRRRPGHGRGHRQRESRLRPL